MGLPLYSPGSLRFSQDHARQPSAQNRAEPTTPPSFSGGKSGSPRRQPALFLPASAFLLVLSVQKP